MAKTRMQGNGAGLWNAINDPNGQRNLEVFVVTVGSVDLDTAQPKYTAYQAHGLAGRSAKAGQEAHVWENVGGQQFIKVASYMPPPPPLPKGPLPPQEKERAPGARNGAYCPIQGGHGSRWVSTKDSVAANAMVMEARWQNAKDNFAVPVKMRKAKLAS